MINNITNKKRHKKLKKIKYIFINKFIFYFISFIILKIINKYNFYF